MPEVPEQPSPVSSSPAPSRTEPAIHVIPDMYYGAALKARVPEQHTAATPPDEHGVVAPPSHRRGLMIGLVIGLLVMAITGTALYVNRGLLFPAPPPVVPVAVAPTTTPPVVTPPPPAVPPRPPENFAVTSTTPQSVALSWTNVSTGDVTVRIERALETGGFQGLTNLAQNSTSFLDVSVQSGKLYRYRLIAVQKNLESTPSPEVSVTVKEAPPVPPEPPKLPPAGLDTDSDGLSDLEESLLKTDLRQPDTDSDGFLDGNEVFHLYNPNGRAPAKLTEAGLVQQLESPVGWKLDLPPAWKTAVSFDGTSSSIVTGHGEIFTVSVLENADKKPILEWYMAAHPDVQATQVLQFRSKRGYQGILGPDLLTTYLPWDNRVFVFTYDLNGQAFINYRTLYSMMLNSLELSGVPQIVLPVETTPLPFEPGATATGTIAAPSPVIPSTSSSAPVAATSSPPAP